MNLPEPPHPHDSFENAVDAFLRELEVNPEANADHLLATFPERSEEIRELLAAANSEFRQVSLSRLPPLPTTPPDVETILPFDLDCYRLTAKIGRGGLGDVYRATQQEPIPREVAVKIVKPELLARELVSRFHNERRSLAKMSHPHVATVLDGGTTADGRPYLVMELVDGLGLTDFCQRHGVGLRERLQLFLKVCAGVQHAHQKGIIHRDLKPSNILVAEIDGTPVPKVIDFGLAKILADSESDLGQPLASSHTQYGQILGTLQYMSPEQASLQTDRIDIRSDIFALGALLFELLTGSTPLASQLPVSLPIDERLRRVREQQPSRPSGRLRATRKEQSVGAEAVESRLPAAAESLSSGQGGSWAVHALRGDLDAICLKATANEPSERYETVAALADDILRFLEHRPVQAATASDWKVMLMYVRRHRALFGTAAAVACILLVSSLVSSLLAFRAFRAERLADARNTQLFASEQATTRARDRAEQNLYVAHMNLVQQAMQESDMQRARDYLSRHIPADDGPQGHDPRGFAWYYWQQQLDDYLGECNTQQEGLVVLVEATGQRVISAGGDGLVQIWDLGSREKLREFRASNDMICGMALASDQQRLATASRDGHLKLWDLQQQTPLLWDSQRDDMLRCVVFDREQQRLLTGGTSGKISIWNVDSGELQGEFQAHEHDVYSLAVSPDGKWLATAGGDYLVKIFDLTTLACRSVLEGHKARARSVDFSPDGRRLASGSYDGTAMLWNLDTDEMLHHLTNHTEQVYRAKFSPDGQTLATCSRDESIILWNVESGAEIKQLLGHRFTIYDLDFIPDGMRLVSSAHDKMLRFWQISEKTRPELLQDHKKAVRGLAISDDQHYLASTGDDGRIVVRAFKTGELLHIFEPEKGVANALVFISHPASTAASDNQLIVAFADGDLVSYALPSGQLTRQFHAHDAAIACIAADPAGTQFTTVCMDGTTKIWDAHSFELRHELGEHTGGVMAVSYSPDGTRLATGSEDNNVIQWDAQTGQMLGRISGHSARVGCTSYSPDGRLLASASRDQTVRIVDAQTGSLQRVLRGHSGSVHEVCFARDGKTLFSAGTDLHLKFWDLGTGEVKTSIPAHELPIMGLQLAPDGNTLLSASGDGTIRFWYGD